MSKRNIFMEGTGTTYALLVSVGIYKNPDVLNLPSAQADLNLMKNALVHGLKIDPDNIRVLGEQGTVHALSFARAVAEFSSMLGGEDRFIFYFSGHGYSDRLFFSDSSVKLQSILNYIERLGAGGKIVILDCCSSGSVEVGESRKLNFGESVESFAGKGTAVMASCAADAKAWLGKYEGRNQTKCSVYTFIVSRAMMSRHLIRKGRISLADMNDEIRYLMDAWNKQHPAKVQQPVFRENTGGTVFFAVEDYHPYIPQKFTLETDDYFITSVKPLSTSGIKRLAVFVIPKKISEFDRHGDIDKSQSNDKKMLYDFTEEEPVESHSCKAYAAAEQKLQIELAEMTADIVQQVKYAKVYESQRSEDRFAGQKARAIWCYFGKNDEDMARSNYFACSIWADDETLRRTYYRTDRQSMIIDNVNIILNSSYEIIRKLQATHQSPEEIKNGYRKLFSLLVTDGEKFIRGLEEVENGTMTTEVLKSRYSGWIRRVNAEYLRLSDLDVPPAGWSEQAEKILETAGWVADLAVLLENWKEKENRRSWWLMKETIRRYDLSLDMLKDLQLS